MKWVLSFLLLALPAMAGREFASSPQKFGHIDALYTATNAHGASGMTVAAWIKPNHFPSADGGDVFQSYFGSTPSGMLGLRTSSVGSGMSNYIVSVARRASGDGTSARYATNRVSINVWTHVATTVSYGSFPDVYIAGVNVNGTTFGSATTAGTLVYSGGTTRPDGIGCAPTTPLALLGTDRVLYGYVAEVGVWRRVLSSSELLALAAGAPPSAFPSGLILYTPLVSGQSSEPNLVGTVATMTNSPASGDHPRIFKP